MGTNDRHCEACELAIPERPYQNPYTVRACSPHCARVLFDRDFPRFAHWGSRFGEREWSKVS